VIKRKGVLQIQQNCSEVPKYRASRTAISGVIPRFSRTISFTVGAETPKSTDNLYGEMPIGRRNSSRRISPGCTAHPAGPSFLMLTILSLNIHAKSVIIRDLYVVRIAVQPDETNSELVVNTNAMLPFPVAVQSFNLFPGGTRKSSKLTAE
jgi:hypothetical protein